MKVGHQIKVAHATIRTGYDCSERECPRGDDPLTSGQLMRFNCEVIQLYHQYIKVFGDSPITEGKDTASLIDYRYSPLLTSIHPIIHNRYICAWHGAEITRPLPACLSQCHCAEWRTLKSVRGEMSMMMMKQFW